MEPSVSSVGIPPIASTMAAAIMTGEVRTDLPGTLPGLTPAAPRRDRLIDTGVRMQPHGDLALCTTQGFEILGLACNKCGRITAAIRPWTKCGACGEFFMEVRQNNRPSSMLRVDWDTGLTIEEMNTSESAARQRCFTTSQLHYSRARARGRVFGASEEVTNPPGGLTSSSEGEDSGVVSAGVTVGAVAATKRGIPERNLCHGSESERKEDTVMSRPRHQWGSASEEEYNLTSDSALTVPEPTVTPDPNPIPAETVSVSERGRQDCSIQQPDLSVLDVSPPRTRAKSIAQTLSNALYVRKSSESCVLPGRGDISKMSKLSRFQRVVQQKVAIEYGLEFPYVSGDVMEEIERHREGWYREAVWEFLGIPKPHRNKRLDRAFLSKFDTCMETWKFGRYIFKDKVVIKRPNREDQVLSITTIDAKGKPVTLPDPQYYK